MKRVVIIIVNYKGAADTVECIQSLWRLSYPSFHVIVVDNDSRDGSVETIQCAIDELTHAKPNTDLQNAKTIELLISTENKGFSGGNNVGIRRALEIGSFDYFWILNNDTLVDENCLNFLIAAFEEYQKGGIKVGIIGTKLLYYHSRDTINSVGGLYNPVLAKPRHLGEGERDLGQYDRAEVAQHLDYITGASMFVSKDFILDVGLLCEDYFIYFEELDWILRGKQKGWQLGYCWRARVYHKEGRSVGTHRVAKMRSALSDFWLQRNRLFFTKKYYPYFLPFVYVTFVVVIFNRILRGQFKRLSWIILLLLSGGRVDRKILAKI